MPAVIAPPFSVDLTNLGFTTLGRTLDHLPRYQGSVGVTTRRWAEKDSDTLVAYTTYMRAGVIRRNGAPNSDQATMTSYFFRNGDLLTLLEVEKTMVEGALAPAAGDSYLMDAEVEGFGVRIQASGRKTYFMRYRNKAGKQRKLTLGRCSDMAPDKARDLARKRFTEVAEGLDPAAEKRMAHAVDTRTVEAMFKGYVDSLRANSRASAGEAERALLLGKHNAADALGRDRPAADVTPTDIVNYVAKFFEEGHRGAANKHRGYIASAYSWATKAANDYTVPADQRTDFGLTRNPAALVAKDSGASKARDRNLTAAEIHALWEATEPGSSAFGFWPETAACRNTSSI